MSSIKITDIQSICDEEGWSLISSKYKNLDSELEFECPKGHKVISSWKKLRNKFLCPICEKNIKIQEAIGKDKIVKKNGFRILALDQATHVTGYAIYDDQNLIYASSYTVKGDQEIERLVDLRMWLISMINNWKPDYIGLEGIQLQDEDNNKTMNVPTFQTLAHLQGALMVTCKEEKVPFEICHTATWRNSCGVKGKTRTDKKRSMQLLVKKWYKIDVSDDVADAVGIGKYLSDKQSKSSQIIMWE